MRKIIINVLVIIVFILILLYIGYNINKENPNFLKDFEIKLNNNVKNIINDKKRDEIEKEIKLEEISYKNIKKPDIKLGKKTIRNMIKYLKYIELYEKEFYDMAPFIQDRNIEIIKKYNELYNKDLVENDIVDKIIVNIDFEIDKNKRHKAGIYNFVAKIPLSNNKIKKINGKIHLDDKNRWFYDINDKKFQNAIKEVYGKKNIVSNDKKKKVLNLFLKELKKLVDIIKNDKGYKELKDHLYTIVVYTEDEKYIDYYNELEKILKNSKFKIISSKLISNQNVYRKEAKHRLNKKAYYYQINLEILVNYNGEKIRYFENLNIHEVEGKINITESYLIDFIKTFKKSIN
ncbi:MAG: hypothetical protein ACQEQE_02935 [Bacillota bacterium]